MNKGFDRTNFVYYVLAGSGSLLAAMSLFDIQHDLGQGTVKQRREILGETTTAILNMID